MRKFLIILLGIVSFVLLAAVLLSSNPRLSDADVKHITAIVHAETAKSILSIELQPDGTVKVSTGIQRTPLEGGGELFTLKRTFGGWKIISRGMWIS